MVGYNFIEFNWWPPPITLYVHILIEEKTYDTLFVFKFAKTVCRDLL